MKTVMTMTVSGTCVNDDDDDGGGADSMGDIDDDEEEVGEKSIKQAPTTAAGDMESFQPVAGACARSFLPPHHTLISRSADEGNCPITSAEQAAVSKYQLDTCRWKVFAAKAAPFRTYEPSEMNESSPLSSLFPFSPVSFFSFPRVAEEGGVLLRTV